ncbi:hypothetical protein BpHYR1_004027 [Brachionus plicatilis]|uniref:Endonuclease/exonuclease/phosphatase domain-containing protein n=1 Tax=Brachionus plicatilis TaxID=10195 RepID=A0A3M7T387_BRAPC|nr:hypothetical protein BpHYR1_004027 [Brachionus plicatilis]
MGLPGETQIPLGTATAIFLHFKRLPNPKMRSNSPLHQNSTNDVTGIVTNLTNNIYLAILSLYVSPSNQLDESLLNTIIKNYPNFIILGDLNARHKSWKCKIGNKKGKILDEIILLKTSLT